MKKIIIKKIEETELEDVTLNLTVSLPLGPAGNILAFDMKWTCTSCGGHGCHTKPCDNHQYLKFENVKDSIGNQQTEYLIQYLERILLKLKNQV